MLNRAGEENLESYEEDWNMKKAAVTQMLLLCKLSCPSFHICKHQDDAADKRASVFCKEWLVVYVTCKHPIRVCRGHLHTCTGA